MTWKITFTVSAGKSFAKLDKYSQQLIQKYLNTRILQLDDPRDLGKPLNKKLKGFWRYRVDKFRIICEITEEDLIILIVKIGHRSEIYE